MQPDLPPGIAGARRRFVARSRPGLRYPVLTIRAPGGGEVTVGVYDMRFGWRDATPWLPAPRYIVGVPDWEALVGRVGLGGWVRVSAGG